MGGLGGRRGLTREQVLVLVNSAVSAAVQVPTGLTLGSGNPVLVPLETLGVVHTLTTSSATVLSPLGTTGQTAVVVISSAHAVTLAASCTLVAGELPATSSAWRLSILCTGLNAYDVVALEVP